MKTTRNRWRTSSNEPAPDFHWVFLHSLLTTDVLVKLWELGTVGSVMTQKSKQGKQEEGCGDRNKQYTKEELCPSPSTNVAWEKKPSASSWSRAFKSKLTRRRLCEHGQCLTPHWLHGERVLTRRRHSLVFQTPIHRELLVQSERYLQRAQMLFNLKQNKTMFDEDMHAMKSTCIPLLSLGFLSFAIKKWEEK